MKEHETSSGKEVSPGNPFQVNERNSLRKMEKAQRGVLWLSTWFVLLVAGIIFGTIAVRGFPVLVKYGSSFLTESPETLFVLKIAADQELELSANDFKRVKRFNPAAQFTGVEEFGVERKRTSFVVPKGSYAMPLTWVRELEKATGAKFKYLEQHANGEVTIEVKRALSG